MPDTPIEDAAQPTPSDSATTESAPRGTTPGVGTPHRTTTRVRYAETDRMGIVHHSAYLTWAEMGRIEWLRAHGLSYRELEAQGVLMPVRSLAFQYKRPARFDDLLEIHTRVAEVGACRVLFANRIFRIDEEGPTEEEVRAAPTPPGHLGDASLPAQGRLTLLTEATIELATVSTRGQVTRLPPRVHQALVRATLPWPPPH